MTDQPVVDSTPGPVASPPTKTKLRERGLLARSSTVAATWALFVGLGMVMIGNGLQGSLLGVRSEAEGFGLAISGLIMAAYFAGFFAGSLYAQRALSVVGHIRVFAALASLASSTVLIHAVFVNPPVWFAMRFVFGLCMAGLYVVVESWLNELATNETRGRLLSVYMLVSMGGVAIGQLLLNVADTNGFTLFVLVSVLVSIALVPISLSATTGPRAEVPTRTSIADVWSVVPTGLITSFLVGLTSGTLLGISAIYASNVGMGPRRLPFFLAAPMAGALATQMPIGWISDRIPRRGVIFATSIVATLAALAPITMRPGNNLVLVSMFLLGGTIFPLYSLGIAYTNDWLRPDQILGASGAQVRVNGAGAVLGPIAAAATMSLFGPEWFYWTMAFGTALIAIWVSYRIFVAEAAPIERQRRYVPFPSRASSMAAHLIPKRKRDQPWPVPPEETTADAEPESV